MAEQTSFLRSLEDTFYYASDEAQMNSDTEVCKKHPPEVLKYYCKNHHEPICTDCVMLTDKHTMCDKVRVKDIAESFFTTEEYKSTQKRLNIFLKELGKMKDELADNLKNIDTTFNVIQDKISSFRQKINVYLDKIQKQLTDETTKMKKIQKTELKKLIAENESMTSELKGMCRSTQNDSGIDASSIFVVTKRAKQRLMTMESELKQIEQSQQLHKSTYLHFCPSAGLQKLLAAKTQLGTLMRYPNVNTTASYRGNIGITTSVQIWNFSINSCTLISPDRLVVADIATDRIRLIDIDTKSFLTSFKASSKPHGVTAISSNGVAVTFPDKKKIQVFEVISMFTEICDIQLNNRCFDIAYKDGKFAVSFLYPSRIEILDIQGMILHTIQPKQGTECILGDPLFTAFGKGNDTVIVSNGKTNKVHEISFKGQIMRTYAHDALQDPSGIGITPDGVLFVCSRGSNSIHVISTDFNRGKVIINNENRTKTPGIITYCDVNQRLYICNLYGDEITVYDLRV